MHADWLAAWNQLRYARAGFEGFFAAAAAAAALHGLADGRAKPF